MSLTSIRAGVSGGLLGKSSSAMYRLRIHVPRLELHADALEAATTQKAVKLEFITWRYAEQEETRKQVLRECLQAASDKARLVAETLGVSLLGVHRFQEKVEDPEGREVNALAADEALGAPRARGASLAVELGMELSHSKRVRTRVVVEFRVGAFTPTASG